MIILSPSLLSVDFAHIADGIAELDRAKVPALHLDVMDGAFVPNISFGAPVIKCLRKETNMIFDVHLMIEEPDRYLEDFKKAGADWVTVHAESCKHLHRTVAERMLGRKLKSGEVVHHIDGNKQNNAPGNLKVFRNQAEHLRWHLQNGGGDAR